MTYRRLLLASASRRVEVWLHSLPSEMRGKIVMMPRGRMMSEYITRREILEPDEDIIQAYRARRDAYEMRTYPPSEEALAIMSRVEGVQAVRLPT